MFSHFILFLLPFFFFNHTATTEIYTLSLHDALPISQQLAGLVRGDAAAHAENDVGRRHRGNLSHGSTLMGSRRDSRPGSNRDRKSTRLNSSHANISYAVFCLKKKKKKKHNSRHNHEI